MNWAMGESKVSPLAISANRAVPMFTSSPLDHLAVHAQFGAGQLVVHATFYMSIPFLDATFNT